MRKKIIITGSNGLLGQKLVKQLVNHPNYDLVATSTGPNRIEKIQGFEYRTLDITDLDQVNKLVDEIRPDILINTAAMTNVDACEDAKEDCWKLNVLAVEYLLEACKKHKTHLIHLSTDFIFDGTSGPYKEEDTPNPLSYYGKSKWASEKVLIDSDYKNWAIARTIIVYGIADNQSRSNIVLWAKGALEKGTPLSIVDDQFRSPTFADDLAKGCILIAEKQARGIYHLSGKDFMSILELVKRVAQYFNLDTSKITPSKSLELNQAAKRPPVTGFILDKAKRELGYEPLGFEEGLAQLDEELK